MEATKFVVAQLGARMHYAVPRILHAAGRLERLYTDIVGPRTWSGGFLADLSHRAGAPALARLAARNPDGIPRNKITHFPGFALQSFRRQRAARSATEVTATYLWAGREFCRRILVRGLGQANAVYVFNSAGLEVLQFARSRGFLTAVEQTNAPFNVVRRYIDQEREAWPGWDSDSSRDALADEFTARERQEWQASDHIVCGSEFVVRGIQSEGGPVDRCHVVPYGFDLAATLPPRQPSAALRVLFSGAVGLRKGVPYLLQAGRRLPAERFSFRLVGSMGVSPAARAELCTRMELTGPVPSTDMPSHYRWADVFVLPSLCEGSATVCYEALAAGLPVITTPNAGSVMRDGVDGFIVPVRDAEAIAEKLELLLSQPELLAEMSRNALARASEFTLEKYQERLLAALPLR